MGLNGNISFSGLMNGDIGETGGTTVVANPTGTATDTLNKIQVSETIYNIDSGANVTITPSLENGTKVADYTIDSTSGSIYAPTPIEYTAGSNVQISEQNVISATDTTYTAGNNVTIENGVISASATSSNNYSTNEQVIGTWIDGNPLYRITYHITSGIITDSYGTIALSNDIIVKDYKGFISRTNGAVDNFNSYMSSDNTLKLTKRSNGMEYFIPSGFTNITELCVTIDYTKSSD